MLLTRAHALTRSQDCCRVAVVVPSLRFIPSNGESKALGQQEPGVPRGFADLSPQIAAAVASARNMLRFPWGHRIIMLIIGVYEEHFCEVPAMRATQENRLLRALHFSMPDPAFPSHMVGGIQAVYGNAIITGLLLGSAFPPRFPSVRVVSYGVQEWLASQTRPAVVRLGFCGTGDNRRIFFRN